MVYFPRSGFEIRRFCLDLESRWGRILAIAASRDPFSADADKRTNGPRAPERRREPRGGPDPNALTAILQRLFGGEAR